MKNVVKGSEVAKARLNHVLNTYANPVKHFNDVRNFNVYIYILFACPGMKGTAFVMYSTVLT